MYGERHDTTLTAMDNLAATSSIRNRCAEAAALEAKILEIRMELRGEANADTVNAMDHLAGTYARQERWAEAEALEEKIL